MVNKTELAILMSMLICSAVSAATLSEPDTAASKAHSANDYTTAFKDWSAAATQGDAKAEYELGSLYEMGEGIPQNYMLAVHWYSKSADLGNVDALNFLSRLYKYGKGVPHNDVEAYKWCVLAKSVGDPSPKVVPVWMRGIKHIRLLMLIRNT